jgi:hypothetical protein
VFHPVDLLRDSKGIYGIGVTDEVSWPHRQVNVKEDCERKLKIVLRSDKFLEEHTDARVVALQKIACGPAVPALAYCAEQDLRAIIHYHMLQRAGLRLDDEARPIRPDGTRGNFWATDRKLETVNRQRFHGLRIGSLRIINGLIAKALAEAAQPEALRESRRFALNHRYEIYRAAAVSGRFLQVVNAFPVLALYMTRLQGDEIEALKLVDEGAPLKNVAGLLGVPMALRRVKPGAAHLALGEGRGIFVDHPDLIYAYMPQSLPLMKFWLRKVMGAGRVDRDFARFTAKKLFTFGETTEEISARLTNTADWVGACVRRSEFVTRPFNAKMSVRTATRLSDEWHETVARIQAGPAYPFPEPWIPGANVDSYQIIHYRTKGHCGNSADGQRQAFSRAMKAVLNEGTVKQDAWDGADWLWRKDG